MRFTNLETERLFLKIIEMEDADFILKQFLNDDINSQVQNVGVNFSFVKFIGLVFLAFMLHSLDHDSPHFVYG